MLNQFKRHPLVIKDNHQGHITIFEFGIGENEAYGFSDADLVDNIEQFIRTTYAVIPDDYTYVQNRHLMKSWKVDEKHLTSKYIEQLELRDKENAKVCRLFITLQNNNLRYSVQFIEDEREYVADVTLDGFYTKVVGLPVSRNQVSTEYRNSFVIQFAKEKDPLDSKSLKFYTTEAMDGLQNFMEQMELTYSNIERFTRQDYCSRLVTKGLSLRDISKVKITKFYEVTDDKDFTGDILKIVVELYNKYIKQTLDETVSVEGVTLTLEIRLSVTMGNEEPSIKVYSDLSSIANMLYSDSTTDQEYVNYWSTIPENKPQELPPGVSIIQNPSEFLRNSVKQQQSNNVVLESALQAIGDNKTALN